MVRIKFIIALCIIGTLTPSLWAKTDSLVTIRISFVGDIMCHTPQLEHARVGKDSFDFNPSFAEIKQLLEMDELTIGNFETTCAGKEMGFSGTFCSQADHDSIRVLDLKGIRTAILNYTYGTNEPWPGKGREYLLNLIDTTNIRKDIDSARESGAEIVIAYYHYGNEMYSDESASQEAIIDFTIQTGADIIIGSHPQRHSKIQGRCWRDRA